MAVSIDRAAILRINCQMDGRMMRNGRTCPDRFTLIFLATFFVLVTHWTVLNTPNTNTVLAFNTETRISINPNRIEHVKTGWQFLSKHRNERKRSLTPKHLTRQRIPLVFFVSILPYQDHKDQNHVTDLTKKITDKPINKVSKNAAPISSSSYSVEQTIVRLGRYRRTDEALHVFYNIQVTPTIRQINAAIDACARAHPARLQTALDIIRAYCTSSRKEDMILDRDANNNDNKRTKGNNVNNQTMKLVQPNVYTFGALMNAIANAGNVDMAVDLVTNTMEDRYGVKPNAVVYNAAITACAKSNPPRPDIAVTLLQQARERKIPLTVNGYNAACSAAANAADWKLAASILQQMTSSPKPDAITYGTVMAACEKCHEWNQCLHFFDQMVGNSESYLQPDRLSLTSALHACQQLGLPDQAIKYLNLMKELQVENKQELGDRDNSLTNAEMSRVRQQSQSNNRRLSMQGPDAVAYRLAISACTRGGAWKDAIATLNSYISDPQQIQPEKDVMAYTAAIHGCENAGEWKQAFVLLDQMRRNGAVPNEVTFAAVIGACAVACSKSVIPSSTMRTSKLAEARRHDDVTSNMPTPQRKALKLLNVLRKDPTVPKPNIQVYNAAIRACAEGLDLQRSFQLLDMLKNEDKLHPTIVTYGTLMTACERVGSVKAMDKVFQLLRQEEKIRPNEIIYGAAISVCRKAGEAERAFSLLQKMIQDGLQPNIATFNTALSAQTDDRDKTNASRNIDRAMVIFHQLQSKKYQAAPNRQTYSLLIRALNQNKQPQQAESLLIEMKDGELKPDVDLFTATIAAYERNGQPLRALRLMELMRKDGYDFYEASVLNNLFKKAVKLANAVGRTWTADGEVLLSKIIDEDGTEEKLSFVSKDVEARLRNELSS